MKASVGRSVAVAVLAVSVAFFAVTLVLPTVKSPEAVTYSVPASPPAPGSYQIEFYAVPPVDAGVPVNVTFTQFQPDSVEFAFSPVHGDTVLPALAHGSLGSGNRFSFAATSNTTTEFRLFVIAYNGSGFTVALSSVWSPYYDVRVYTAPAVFLIVASSFAAYYFWQRMPRQRQEEKVRAELSEAERRGHALGRFDRTAPKR